MRLEKAQAIAHGAALDSFLGTVATKVEYYYREAAERSLNLSASLFTQNRTEKVAYYWKQRPAKGAKRLFLVDLTQSEFGNFLAFDPEKAKLYAPDASDESLAMVLAANPLHMLNLRQRGMESAALTVDERNPDYRIILNPILDDGGRVVGLAGMILDEEFLKQKLLPSIITVDAQEVPPLGSGRRSRGHRQERSRRDGRGRGRRRRARGRGENAPGVRVHRLADGALQPSRHAASMGARGIRVQRLARRAPRAGPDRRRRLSRSARPTGR